MDEIIKNKSINPLNSFFYGIVFLVCASLSATSYALKLTDIQFNPSASAQPEIQLTFDGNAPKPNSYAMENPARIVIDLPNVMNGLSQKSYSPDFDIAKEITVLEAENRTRMVINLAAATSYQTRLENNHLFITLNDVSPAAETKTVNTVNDISLERGENGAGRVVIDLSNPDTTLNVKKTEQAVEVTLPKVSLPSHLARQLSVSEYGTPVKSIDAKMAQGDTVIVINTQGDFEQYSYQANNRFVINISPVSAEQVKQQTEQNFDRGSNRLTLNFQDIEVRDVLQIIADFTGLNLVASDSVTGNITLRLKDVPWDQALDLILKTKGLDKRVVGNVILVAPAEELAAREKLELESKNQVADLAPLQTEYIPVNYANAKNLAAIFSTKEGVLSERGSAIVDDRTNTIIVTDTARNIREFKNIALKLDVPVKQVLIEARIVKADSEFARGLGVRWGGYYFEKSGAGIKHAGGSLQTLDDIQQSQGNNPINTTKPDHLVVDLGVADQIFNASTFAIGLLRDSSLLELELSALEGEGKGHVVSQPKVVTADQQMARIESGTEIPYQEATSSGATSVEFKDAVLALEVTPQITPNDRIIMKLRVNQDSVGDIFNGVPSINTNEIETQVLVENGETIVLGGIYQTETNDTISKTPFLGDIPVLGWLFKSKKINTQKSELLIFITPKVVEQKNI